jgi:voltage-gated potassium channel
MGVTIDFLHYFGLGLLYCSPFLLFFSSVIFGVGFLVGHIEKWNWRDTIYWTIITATTVGYGDIRPTKGKSRLYTITVVLVGMMFTGVIVALTIAATTETLKRHINVDEAKERFNKIEHTRK